jgi:hypothetical protein
MKPKGILNATPFFFFFNLVPLDTVDLTKEVRAHTKNCSKQ